VTNSTLARASSNRSGRFSQRQFRELLIKLVSWAVNYTAEHHKPLFWRRLPTKLSPLVVPQLCPQLAFLNILSLDSLQDHELLFFRCASFLQKDFPKTYPNDAQLDYLRIAVYNRPLGSYH